MVDSKAFRQTVGQFATGVTIVAIAAEGAVHGMTANSFTSLSLDPPLVLFCVAKRARMAEKLKSAEGFSVNILRYDQQALSTFFAGGWKEAAPPPFRFVPWPAEHAGESDLPGAPRLQGCAAALGCTLEAVLEGGDHWIVTGRVVALHLGVAPRKPLLFYAGQYEGVDPAESSPAPDLATVAHPMLAYYDPWHKDSA